MKLTLTFASFCDEWNGWTDRKDTFSYAGKRALFDYLEQYEQETGEDLELDIVSLCCDFTEYDSAMEAVEEYTENFKDDDKNEEENEADARKYLKDRTTVIDVDGGGVIIQNF